jgi:3-hydroxybutyrate dehydrogenase/3-oxoacyl-[acyl-carrier protein] reductase
VDLGLSGRRAIVTGGSKGLGKAIAAELAAEGAAVAICARHAGELAATAAELAKQGGDGPGVALAHVCDVTDPDQVNEFIEAAASAMGGIDILVNNAGGAARLAPTVDLYDEDWDLVMKWNLYSTFWATRAALRDMLPRKSGRIINISSVEGKHGKPVVTSYCAAKHAINGFTKAVAKEVGTEGITINSICPGLILTDIVLDNGPKTAAAMGITFDEMVDLYVQDSAIKRPNTVEEVAAVAVLLASEEAAGITGATFSVDGGTAAY